MKKKPSYEELEQKIRVLELENKKYRLLKDKDFNESVNFEALSRKNEEHAFLLEAIPAQIWFLTDTQTYGAVNQAHADFLGLKKEQIEHQSLDKLESQDIVQKYNQNNQKVFKNKSKIYYKEWIENALGEKRLLAITKIPKLNKNNNVEYVVCTGLDITEFKKAENQLRLQSLVLDQIEDRVTITDLFGVITYVNQAESKTLGYNKEMLIGSKTERYGEDPEKGATQKEILETTLKKGMWLGEVVNYASDGCEIIMDCRTQVIYDERGEPISLCGIATDITKRKHMERELKKNLGLLNSLIESIPDMIFYKDTKGFYLGCNTKFEEFVGLPKNEIVGKNDFDLFDRELASFFRHYDKLMLRKMEPNSNEEWITYPDGRKVLLDMLKTPYWGPDGDLTGILGVGRDITRRKENEQALKESEKRLLDIIEFFPDAILAINKEKQVIIWNKAIEEMTNIPASEMIGRGDYAYTIPFYDTARPQLMDLVFEHSQEIEALYPDITRHGETLLAEVFCNALNNNTGAWVFAKASPLYDASGSIIGAIESIRDITEKKQAEKALENTNRTLQQMLDGTQDVIGFQYPDHTVIRYNQAGYDLLGLRPEEINGQKCYELIGRNRECEICATKKACLSKKVETVEKYQPEIDMYVKATANPVINDQGEIIYIIEQLTDISDQKRAEEALRESEKRFRNLLEDVDRVAVQGYDNQRRVFFWNKASENLYGYTEKEALGAKLEDLIIPIHMRDKVIRNISAWLENGVVIPPGEIELVRKDGTSVPVYSSHVMQENAKGKKEIYCIDIELTEIKKITNQLQNAKELAESANQAKSEFLANMSHEIRTPLNGVMGMLQLMQSTDLDEEQQEYVEMSLNSSKRLNKLLTDILDISKFEVGKIDVRQEEFDLNEVFDSVQETFKYEIEQKGLDFNSYIDLEIPQTLIGDSTRLTQILFNLVGNSIKYTNEGKVHLDAQIKSGYGSNCSILFTISDTGNGIPSNLQEHIFEIFSQANTSGSPYTRKYEGAGLGLAIVKRLTTLLGGHIFLESEKNQGTTVYVVIPFKTGKSSSAEFVEESSTENKSFTDKGYILVAEDDYANQIVAQKILEKMGYIVKVASNGQEAVKYLQKENFDLILMDIKMPVMDGIEATKQIRNSNFEVKDIPIVALTAYAMKEEYESFLKAGINDYISKPLDKDRLAEVLNKNLPA